MNLSIKLFTLTLLTLYLTTISTAATTKLPSISYKNLLNPPSSSIYQKTATAITEALTTYGGLTISDIPDYKTARINALTTSVACLTSESLLVGGGSGLDASDSIKRVSAGNRVENGQGLSSPLQFFEDGDSVCLDVTGNAELYKLRQIVDSSVMTIFDAIDNSGLKPIKVEKEDGGVYKTHSSLFSGSEGLEHLHLYVTPNSKEDVIAEKEDLLEKNQQVQNLHTDTGVLIAMTTGLETNPSTLSNNYNLNVLPPGYTESVTLDVVEDELVIIVGEGYNRWVVGGGDEDMKMRPLPHELVRSLDKERDDSVDESVADVRAWYGRMYFLPKDAMISSNKVGKNNNSNIPSFLSQKKETKMNKIPFGELLPKLLAKSINDDDNDSAEYLPLGCTIGYASSVQCSASDGSDGIMCWTNCVSIADLSCGASEAECIDMSTMEEVDGEVMCPSGMTATDCMPMCPMGPTPPTNRTTSDFCNGNGIDMYMDGFRWVLSFTGEPQESCLNLFFTTWTLDTKTKFYIAMGGNILLGIAVEGFSSIRKLAFKKMNQNKFGNPIKTVIASLLHGVQAFMGYMLMLSAMTYSMELLLCVVTGLSIGYGMNHGGGSAPPDGFKDPCCDFDEDGMPITNAADAGHGYRSIDGGETGKNGELRKRLLESA